MGREVSYRGALRNYSKPATGQICRLTAHESPDTTPWAADQHHFSGEHTEGLADEAESQVPPNTNTRRL